MLQSQSTIHARCKHGNLQDGSIRAVYVSEASTPTCALLRLRFAELSGPLALFSALCALVRFRLALSLSALNAAVILRFSDVI